MGWFVVTCVSAQTRYPMETCGQRRFKCDRTTNELLEVSLVYLWSSTFCQTDQNLDKLSKVCILYPFNIMHSITWICMHAWGLSTIGLFGWQKNKRMWCEKIFKKNLFIFSCVFGRKERKICIRSFLFSLVYLYFSNKIICEEIFHYDKNIFLFSSFISSQTNKIW